MEERGGEEIASVQVCVTGQYIEGQSPTNALTHMHTHTHTVTQPPCPSLLSLQGKLTETLSAAQRMTLPVSLLLSHALSFHLSHSV